MLYIRNYLVCISVLCAAECAAAQVTVDTTVALPEATVTADRGQTSPEAAVARITLVPLQDAAAQRSRSLADLLDTSTGLYVRRYGPSGTATLSFRGTDPTQTEILLDGLRITDPQSGQVDLSLIPIVLLESVEIVHGPGSESGTSGGLGGTVKLRTVQAGQDSRIRLHAASGAYGKRTLSGLAAGGTRAVSAILSVEHAREEGAFPYVNGAVQPPVTTTRVGADMEAESVFGKVSMTGTRHQASLAGWINGVERGLPGPGNAPPVPSRQEDDHVRAWLNSQHRLPGVTLSTDWSIQTADLHYTNTASATDNRTRTTSFEGRVAAGVPIDNSILVRTGGEWAEHATSDVDERRLALFSSGTVEKGAVIAEGSLRGETWAAPSGTRRQLVPRAGFNVKDFPFRNLRLKASGGRTWTIPSLIDRYWVPGGNRNLEPETGWSGELGLMLTREHVEFELTGFSATLSDRIVWIPGLVGSGVQVWRPTNVGKVRSYGFEFSAAAGTPIGDGGRFHGGVTLTYTEAIDRSDPAAASYGYQLKYVPRMVVCSAASVTSGGVDIGLSGRIVGKRYVTSDETAFLPSYAVVGARASYEAVLGAVSATLSVSAENLLNDTYSTIRFYPMPPRHFGFGLNLEWRKRE